jgi:molybdopterin-guanine dinucleotide biosynthesis protein A
LQLAGSVTPHVVIVGARKKFGQFGTVIEDIYPGCGPLGGIHAALKSSTKELNLILAVDLPLVSSGLLHFLIERARQGAVVTVPHAGGRLQPLCAIYRPAFAQVAEAALKEGNNKIDCLFDQVTCSVVRELELIAAGFSPGMFRNLNTPGDVAEAAKNA